MTRFEQKTKRRLFATLIAITCLASGAGLESVADAADIEVNSTGDSGTGSLREAMLTAVDGDRIVFNLPGPQTIPLLSDLPIVSNSITFFNQNTDPITVDRNGFAALNFTGSTVDLSDLIVIDSVGPASNDIVTGNGTTVFGAGSVTGDLRIPGTVSPGASASAGSIGTMTVTGDLDISDSTARFDLSAVGGTPTSDRIVVVGTADALNATVVPNFVGDEFAVGQQFLVLDTTNPLANDFLNSADAFQLPDQPFLEAIRDPGLGADDFGFLIQDNGATFESVAVGCNQTSAAQYLDVLRAGVPPASVTALVNSSNSEFAAALNQLSGSIFPSLIGAEINHIQSNLESVRDRVMMKVSADGFVIVPWLRGYGGFSSVDADECQTLGYRQEIGGMEMGGGIQGANGLSAFAFAHFAGGTLNSRGVDQQANIESYRGGGSLLYEGGILYVMAAGGAGIQRYDVKRSLSSFNAPTFAESSFDGDSQFGLFEIGVINDARQYIPTPFFALQATRVGLDPINETGDADFTLSNSGDDGDSLRSILGLALNQSATTPIGPATTRFRFGWMHEYLNESETFVSEIGTAVPAELLVDRGVTAGLDWALLRLQLDMGTFLGGRFNAAYQGQYNGRSAFHSFVAGSQWIY